MHLMTRLPAGGRASGPPFDGATFRFKDDSARLTEKDGARFVELTSAAGGSHRLSRHARHRRAVSRGLRGRRGRRAAHRARARAAPPVSYVFETKSFRLKGYSVLVSERPGPARGRRLEPDLRLLPQHRPVLRRAVGRAGGPGRAGLPGARWSTGCCRATGAGASRSGADGGALLPSAVAAEVTAVGGTPARAGTPIGEALKPTASTSCAPVSGARALRRGRDRLRGLPRRQPRARRRSARAPGLRAAQRVSERAAGGGAATGDARRAVNRVCARCHQVLFSRYPFTWEGGQRRGGKPGGSSITSGEARDFLLGGCARQMSCATCHDPHARGSPRRAGSAGDARRQRGLRPLSPAVRRAPRRWRPTRTTIRPGRAAAASPATCRRRTWASATR